MARTAHPQTAIRRVAIVGPSGYSLVKARGPMIQAVLAERHHVLCLAPTFAGAEAAALETMGVEHRTLRAKPAGLDLFPTRRAIADLTDDFRDWRPHVVLAYGPETLTPATVAAKQVGVPHVVALVAGLPQPVAGQSGRGQAAVLKDIARALAASTLGLFHNSQDPLMLQKLKLLPSGLPIAVVPGSGVDVEHQASIPLPALGEGLSFLMVSRLDRQKGVLDYCEAAQLVRMKAPQARFMLGGPAGHGATGLTASHLAPFREAVTYLGVLDDVRPALARCHVYVHPSYSEGMPPVVLDALAAGRPIIVTDIPGCRDTVDERVNGCFVPVGNPPALAAAIETFLKRPDLIPAMARASRSKAERRFDQRTVNAATLAALGLGESGLGEV